MAGIPLQRYVVALVVKPGTTQEATRDTGEILCVDDAEAVQKAEEWAKYRAADGDFVQVTHNGRGVRSIELFSTPSTVDR